MKSLAAGLLAQASAAGQAPCLLVEIAGWNGSTRRWALSDASVTYGGQTYLPRWFSPGSFEASADGGAEVRQLALENVALDLSALQAADDPSGCAVTFRRVYLDALTVGEEVLTGLVVDGYRLTDTQLVLNLAVGDPQRPTLFPARTASPSCDATYKDARCGYAGAEPVVDGVAQTGCDHSLEDCKLRSNLLNFRGIPQEARRD